MSPRPPSFDDLFDGEDDLTTEERERLYAAHELLARAEPPPELPPALEAPPADLRAPVVPLRRRRRVAALVAVAAAAALALFGLGYLAGGSTSDAPAVVRTVELTGRDGAVASLAVLPEDNAGNWPMQLTVSGLDPLPAGQSYELWLTHDGELAESCGSFNVAGEQTVVTLNAPYRLTDFTGWVVTNAADAGAFVLETESL